MFLSSRMSIASNLLLLLLAAAGAFAPAQYISTSGVMQVVIRVSEVGSGDDAGSGDDCPLRTSSSIDGGSSCHRRPDRSGHRRIFQWRLEN
ncbi:hypothetical protein KSP40_PGU015768 [Platanthera guangdongensis]|uniref:Uncharacterized protein n=1 Tax=Platanthera guangdongensis TaxID=2320717 RepID=A0ABR2MBE0_9ASPA